MSRARIVELVQWWGWRRIVGGTTTVVAVVLVVYFAVRVDPPPVEDSIPLATNTSAVAVSPNDVMQSITVHVAGEVQHPGVYTLPSGSRVIDAVEAAGGVTGKAHTDAINLAAPLVDAVQVVVPRKGARVTRPPNQSSSPAAVAGSTLVNVNSASASELDDLPGVGPATAKAIVDTRAAKGPFAAAEDLLDVPGIGPAKLAQIRPLITW
ncbi:MAG: helix-hairpin-helix domain-containing protein [Ilumatobacteraceae bacterium]